MASHEFSTFNFHIQLRFQEAGCLLEGESSRVQLSILMDGQTFARVAQPAPRTPRPVQHFQLCAGSKLQTLVSSRNFYKTCATCWH